MNIVSEKHDDFTLIQPQGEIRTKDTPHVTRIFMEFKAHPVNVILDLSQTPYLSSTIIGLISTVHRELETTGHKLVLLHSHEKIKELFRITKLEELLVFADSLDEAKKLVSG